MFFLWSFSSSSPIYLILVLLLLFWIHWSHNFQLQSRNSGSVLGHSEPWGSLGRRNQPEGAAQAREVMEVLGWDEREDEGLAMYPIGSPVSCIAQAPHPPDMLKPSQQGIFLDSITCRCSQGQGCGCRSHNPQPVPFFPFLESEPLLALFAMIRKEMSEGKLQTGREGEGNEV